MATASEERALERIKQHCKQVGVDHFNMKEDTTCSLKPLGAGLNFMSDAYFAILSSKTNSIRMFVKVPPEMDAVRNQLFKTIEDSGMRVFEREFFVYTELQEEFENLMTAAGENCEDFHQVFVTPYILPGEMTIYRTKNEPLVLEDLGQKGYKMWEDEFGGMDLPHTIAVMEALGSYHALSMALLDGPGVKNEILNDLINLDFKEVLTEEIINLANHGMDTFNAWMEASKQDQDNIRKAHQVRANNKWIEIMLEIFNARNDFPYNVILHGDSRANNFMFRYSSDKNTPVDVKILDFQMSFRFGIFYDLLYFMFSSVSSSVLLPNYDHIIKKYHTSLVGVLARLNYKKKRPTLEEISTMLSEKVIYGYYMGVVVCSIICQSEEQKDVKYRSLLEIAKHFKFFN